MRMCRAHPFSLVPLPSALLSSSVPILFSASTSSNSFSPSIAVVFAPFRVVGRDGDSAWVHSLRDTQDAVTGIIVHCTVSQIKTNVDSSMLNKIPSCKWRQRRRDPCEVSRHHHLQWKCSFWALGKLQVCVWRLCRRSFQPLGQEEDHAGSAAYQPAQKSLPCDAWDHTPSCPGGSLCLWVVRSIITITRCELWLVFFFPHLCRALPVF